MERRKIINENYLGCQDSCIAFRQQQLRSDDLERAIG